MDPRPERRGPSWTPITPVITPVAASLLRADQQFELSNFRQGEGLFSDGVASDEIDLTDAVEHDLQSVGAIGFVVVRRKRQIVVLRFWGQVGETLNILDWASSMNRSMS